VWSLGSLKLAAGQQTVMSGPHFWFHFIVRKRIHVSLREGDRLLRKRTVLLELLKLLNSSRSECHRLDFSAAIIVRPSGATAKWEIGPSPVKPALYSPLSKFQYRFKYSSTVWGDGMEA
jgi:hypothetical protein